MVPYSGVYRIEDGISYGAEILIAVGDLTDSDFQGGTGQGAVLMVENLLFRLLIF